MTAHMCCDVLCGSPRPQLLPVTLSPLLQPKSPNLNGLSSTSLLQRALGSAARMLLSDNALQQQPSNSTTTAVNGPARNGDPDTRTLPIDSADLQPQLNPTVLNATRPPPAPAPAPTSAAAGEANQEPYTGAHAAVAVHEWECRDPMLSHTHRPWPPAAPSSQDVKPMGEKSYGANKGQQPTAPGDHHSSAKLSPCLHSHSTHSSAVWLSQDPHSSSLPCSTHTPLLAAMSQDPPSRPSHRSRRETAASAGHPTGAPAAGSPAPTRHPTGRQRCRPKQRSGCLGRTCFRSCTSRAM